MNQESDHAEGGQLACGGRRRHQRHRPARKDGQSKHVASKQRVKNLPECNHNGEPGLLRGTLGQRLSSRGQIIRFTGRARGQILRDALQSTLGNQPVIQRLLWTRTHEEIE